MTMSKQSFIHNPLLQVAAKQDQLRLPKSEALASEYFF